MANHEKDNDSTTIAVKKTTYRKLQKKCLKTESYSDLIERLLFEQKGKKSEQKAGYEDAL